MKMFPFRHTIATGLLLLIGIVAAKDLRAQGTLIPITTRRDMVFDHAGKYLYVTTSDGFVRRYNLAARQFDASYNLGGSLNGVDIVPDDSFLLVAQNNTANGQGTFHKLNLTNGSVTNVNYILASGELGAWDIVIKADGKAFLSTQAVPATDPVYSAWTPLRELNLATNGLEVRAAPSRIDGHGRVSEITQLYRSADGTRVYFLESFGDLFTYTTISDSFTPLAGLPGFLNHVAAAVSRDGKLIATPFAWTLIDAADDFAYVHTLNYIDGGVAFDGQKDIFYGVDSYVDQIVAYDTKMFSEKFRLNIGENVGSGISEFDSGNLVASPNGAHLALATPSGVRLFTIPTAPAPSPSPSPTLGAPRGMVFDHAGQYLYVATAQGLIARYNLSTGVLDNPYDLGGTLTGIDIAPDDSFLLVAQTDFGISQGTFHKVDLRTGDVTNISYWRNATNEAGAWDVRIASNGLALATTRFGGSGFTPLHQIDLSADQITERSDTPGTVGAKITDTSRILRSADATRLWILESGSAGSMFMYDAMTNTFGPRMQRNAYTDQAGAALNRNGSLLSLRLDYTASLETAPEFQLVHTFANCDGMVAFDAVKDILYATNSATDEIVAYDTNTLAEQFRFNIGEDVSVGIVGSRIMTASHDGNYLALLTETTLRIYDVSHGPPPVPTPTPTSLPAVATPAISPNGGTFKKKVKVSLACATSGANIYYTLNGSDPTTSSRLYGTKLFKLKGKGLHVVKARAFKSGYSDSVVTSATFKIK